MRELVVNRRSYKGVSGMVHEPKNKRIMVHGHKKFVFSNHENKKVRYSF